MRSDALTPDRAPLHAEDAAWLATLGLPPSTELIEIRTPSPAPVLTADSTSRDRLEATLWSEYPPPAPYPLAEPDRGADHPVNVRERTRRPLRAAAWVRWTATVIRRPSTARPRGRRPRRAASRGGTRGSPDGEPGSSEPPGELTGRHPNDGAA